jgi:hypothetical protein
MKRIIIPVIFFAMLSVTSCMRSDMYDNGDDVSSLLQLPGFGTPKITSITSTTTTGAYSAGQTIDITITFSEQVSLTGTGTLDVTLDTGVTVSTSSLASPTTATFAYTINAPENSNALTVTSVALNGVSLVSVATGNAASLNVPLFSNLNKAKIKVDTIIPTITSITSSSSNGAYGTGKTVDITINFSEDVTLGTGGSLDLSLDSGGNLNITPFPLSNSVSGTYTVVSGNNSPKLFVLNAILSSGTLADEAGNAVDLTIPAANLSTKSIAIDTLQPTILSIATSSSSGVYGPNSGGIDITVNFSENVTLTGMGSSMLVDLNTTPVHTLSYSSISDIAGKSITYTVQSNETTGMADLQATGISVSGGQLQDAAGNPMVDFTIPVNLPAGLSVDGIAPVLSSITSSTVNGTYGQGAIIDVTLNFSEPVTQTGDITVNLNSGGSLTVYGFAGLSSASGSYSVASPETSPDLTVTSITMGGATIRDVAQNNSVMTLPAGQNLADNKAIVIDAVAPRIQSITSSTGDGTYGETANIDVTVNFTENVTLTGNLQIVLDTGGTVTIAPFGPANTASGTYTVGAGQTSSDLTVSPGGISVGGGTLLDAAGNSADLSLPSGQNLGNNSNIVIDSYGGTVTTISSTMADGTYGAAQNIDVVVTFSEPVTLSGGDLLLTLDTGYVVHVSPFTNSNTGSGNYLVSFPDSSADLDVMGVGLSGGATITDQYGNPTTLGLPANNLATTKNIIIDTAPPTITSVASSTADGTYGIGTPIQVQVNFSDAVTLTGGSLEVVLSSGKTLSINSISGASSATVTYTVEAGNDTAGANIQATSVYISGPGQLIDAAGNPMSDFTVPLNFAGNNIIIDGIAPTITSITSTTANGTYGIGASIDVTLAFSKPVALTGGPITLSMDSGGTVTISDFPLSATATGTYNVANPQASADLTVSSINLAAATLSDAAGNGADITLPAGNNLANNSDIVIDTTAPGIQSITSITANGTYGIGATVDVTINFTDNVTLSGGNMQVLLNTGGVVIVTPFPLSSNCSGSYTVGVGESTADLSVSSVTLLGSTLQDSGGNNAVLSIPGGQNLANLKDIAIDTDGGTVSSITSTAADGTYGIGQTVDVVVTFTEPMTLVGNDLVMVLDTGYVVHVAPFTNSSVGTGYYTISNPETTADLTVTGIGLASGASITDQYGNPTTLGLPANNLGVLKNIAVDTVVPAIASITGTDGIYSLGNTVTFTVNFTKPVILSGGTIWLQLDSGGSAFVSPFGSSSSATATYLVGAGNASADLTVNVGGISLTGGTLKDSSGNNVDLTVPAGNNLGDNNTIVIDTIAPAAPVVTTFHSNNPNSAYARSGNTITLAFTTAEPVNIMGVTIGSHIATVTDLGGSINWQATYTLNGSEANENVGYDIMIGDPAGNTNTASAAGGVTIDNTAPGAPSVATFLSDNANTAYAKSGDIITLSFTTSEAVSLPTVTIGSHAAMVVDMGAAMSWQATYTVAAGDPLENAGYNIAIQDTAGNTSSANASGGVTIDTTAPLPPVVAAYHSNNANTSYAKSGDTITLDFHTIESAGTPSVTLGIYVATVADMGGGDWRATYLVNGTEPDNDPGYTITIHDTAGNIATTNGAGGVFIDNSVPGVPNVTGYYSTNMYDSTYANGSDIIELYFTTSESLTITPAVVIGGNAATAVNDMGGGINWRAVYFMTGSEADGAAGYSISIQDGAGNSNGTTGSGGVTIDCTPPTINSVTALESTPGTYFNGGGPGAGFIIVRVNFSESVAIDGGTDMYVDLNSGKTLTYSGFPFTNTVCVNYSVEAGNTTAGADLTATSISVQATGFIRDHAGNEMTNFSIPSPTMTGFYVDGIGPNYSVNIVSNNGFGGPQYARAGDTITLTVSPSEAISKPAISIAGKSEPTITVASGAGDTWVATYTMQAGDPAGIIAWTVNSVQDTYGNAGTGGSDGSSVNFSEIKPTVASVTPNTTLSNANVGAVAVTIEFSKQMDTSYTPAIKPQLTGLLSSSSYFASSNTQWLDDTHWRGEFTFVDDNEETTGTYSISGFRDIMGNVMTADSSHTVAVDTKTPIGSIAMNYLNKSQWGSAVNVVVQFDTVMDPATIGTATLNIPSTFSTYNLSSGGWSNGDRTWTGTFAFNDVDDSDIDATGATFNVTGFQDLSFNAMDPLSHNITVDTKRPTVFSVDSLTPDGTYGLSYGVDITVNFSEPVTMTSDNLTIGFTDFPTTANLGQFPLATSVHATYTVASGDTSASLNVSGLNTNSGTLRDAAGNDADLVSFPPAGNNLADNSNIVIDSVQPTISYFWSSGAMSQYCAGQSVNVTAHFNEPVTLNAGSLYIPLNTGGTAIALPPQSGNDISATYMVMPGDTTPLLEVNGSLSLMGGSLRDGANNDANIITLPSMPNRLSDNDPIAIDGILPEITDVTADMTSDGSYGVGTNIDVTLHFSEQVALTGGPITVHFDSGGSMQINNFALSNTATGTYTVAASQNSADLGVSSIDMAGASLTDAAGNITDTNILPDRDLAYDRAIVIDTVVPTILSVTSSYGAGSYGVGEPIDITVNFSEPVTKVGGMPLYMDLNSGAVPQHINSLTNSSSATITYTVANPENTSPGFLLVTSLYVTSSTIQDAAGNQMTDFSIPMNLDPNQIIVDAVPPTIVSAVTMDANPVDGRIDHYKITFSENVNDSSFNLSLWNVAGYNTGLALVDGNFPPPGESDIANNNVIYLSFTPMSFPDTGAKPLITTSALGGITDLAGNQLVQLNTDHTAMFVETDGAKPRIESFVGSVGSDTAQVTFSEPVDSTMGGGCSGTLSSSNLSYQNSYSGGATSIMNLSLDSNACDDSTVVMKTNTAFVANDIDVDGIMPPASIIRDAADNTAMPFVSQVHGMTKSMQLTFDTTSAGANVSSSVTNFPLLVRLSDPGIISTVQDGAPDLRFNDTDGTPLAYQIERWDKGNSAAEVWVLVPTVTGNSNTDYITMYFDDKTDGSVPGRQDSGKVFGTGNNFVGVWHFGEESGSNAYDSTANKNNGVTNTTTINNSGNIGLARNLDGTTTSYIQVPDSNSLDATGSGGVSISAWIKDATGTNNNNPRIVSKKTTLSSNYEGYELYINSSTNLINMKAYYMYYIYGTSSDIDTSWHYITGHVYNTLSSNTTNTIYFDGGETTSYWSGNGSLITAGTEPVYFGTTSGSTHGNLFSGLIDEIRIENTYRGDAWVKLCYENQRQDQTLIKYWYDDNFTYRLKVTVQGSKVAGTVTQFPVYVNMANLTSNFWSNVSIPLGSSNIVVTAGNGLTKLPREVVSFTDSGSSGTGELWFRAPQLDAGKDVSFYVYFGGTGTDSNDSAVWSNGYKGVWHMQSSASDSSGNGNSGAVSGSGASFVTGIVGNSFTTTGAAYIDVTTSSSLDLSGGLTLSAWFRSSTNLSGMTVMSKRSAILPLGYNMTVDTLNDILEVSTGLIQSPGAAALSAGELTATFYYYAATISGTTAALYLNGVNRTTDATVDSLGISGTNLNIGRMTDGTGYFNGALDEVRISSVARSAPWVTTEYNNQFTPGSFYSVSTTLESN